MDLKSGRPVETPQADYSQGPKVISPSSSGAHNWHPMAFDKARMAVFLPMRESAEIFQIDQRWKKTGAFYDSLIKGWNIGLESGDRPQTVKDDLAKFKTKAGLKSLNPVSGKVNWIVQHRDNVRNGGVLATAGGLVFQGLSSGVLRAYDSDNGKRLWSFDTHTGIMAPPVTFLVKGKQYIAILAGLNYNGENPEQNSVLPTRKVTNPGRLLVFASGAKNKAKQFTAHRAMPDIKKMSFRQKNLEHGEKLYRSYCIHCHGNKVRTGGIRPDLRYMSDYAHTNFKKIVLEGILSSGGMASFADALSPEDAEAIHDYIKSRTYEDLKNTFLSKTPQSPAS